MESPTVRVPIWMRPDRAAKGPAPSRTRQQLAAAAVALADRDGMEAVSIRAVASSLEIGAASLYRYVDSKSELLDLMIDWVEGEDGVPPAPTGDWRADLTMFAHKIRESTVRHPWTASIGSGRPSFGPHSLAWNEYGLAAMDPLDLSADEMIVASELLHSFVRGFVARELANRNANLADENWQRNFAPYLESIVAAGQHPRFERIVREASLQHVENRSDQLFAVSLQRLLDAFLPHWHEERHASPESSAPPG